MRKYKRNRGTKVQRDRFINDASIVPKMRSTMMI
jgi:hypothetical protein